MLSRRLRPAGDDGQLILLIVFYTLVAAVMAVIAIDVSKVFLARRALSSVADAAALAAAQQVNERLVYSGATGCDLPLDAAAAAESADAYLADAADRLRGTVTTLDPPVTSVRGTTVTVRLEADIRVPFDRVVTVLSPGRSPTVHLSVVAHARSPLVGACPAGPPG